MKTFRRSLYFFLWLPALLTAQQADTIKPSTPTIADTMRKDTLPKSQLISIAGFTDTLPKLRFEIFPGMVTSVTPTTPAKDEAVAELSNHDNRDYLFYLVIGLLLLLGCLKFFYDRYFANLFRVFFNSSLRQSQLTDQLLQAKLPSLLFNLFFVIATGFFIYLLLCYFKWLGPEHTWWISLPACVAAVGVIYTVKYFTLKFTGWITSYKESADVYIFIIFLINKILGVLLVPVIVVMAFAQSRLVHLVVVPALIVTGLFVLLRFFRSYGLLQGRLKVSRFHFFLYVIGIEVLPILMIYKGLVLYLNKSI